METIWFTITKSIVRDLLLTYYIYLLYPLKNYTLHYKHTLTISFYHKKMYIVNSYCSVTFLTTICDGVITAQKLFSVVFICKADTWKKESSNLAGVSCFNIWIALMKTSKQNLVHITRLLQKTDSFLHFTSAYN